MSYPGDRGLDRVVQQRIMTAFGEAVRLYREGHAEECRTILRSILEIDPAFAPAQRLGSAVASGTPVDLGELLGQVSAVAGVRPAEFIEKARQAMAAHDFAGARVILQELLRELPGHAEARALLAEVQERARGSAAVTGPVQRAQHGFGAGTGEAAAFPGAAERVDEPPPRVEDVRQAGGGTAPAAETQPEFEFDVEVGGTSPAAQPLAPAGSTGPVPPGTAAPRLARELEWADETEPQPGEGGAPGFEPAAGDFLFSAAEAPAMSAGADDRVAALLQEGQEAFDRGDFAGAIDTWSRIYLVDPHHAEAGQRIEEARRRREEVERLAEHRYFEARDAFEEGRTDEARRLCQEVLQLQPQHLEAHDLLQRLDTPAAPPPPPMPPPEVAEEDLFRDDFVPAKTPASGAYPVATAERAPVPRRAPVSRWAVPARVAGLPLPVAAAVGGALVLLLVVSFLVRGMFLGGSNDEALSGLAEAEKLAAQGQYQQAVTLLQSLEVEGEAANQVRQRLLEYQRQLRSTKSAAAPDEIKVAREALAAGARVRALGVIRRGLAKVPGDKELQALAAEIAAASPALAPLADAVEARNYEAVRQQAAAVLTAFPGDGEAQRLWGAATFDLAVTLLRKYQVAAAYSLLEELDRQGEDAEVRRLKEFAGSYRSRPIDPRYQIFVSSVELRPLE